MTGQDKGRGVLWVFMRHCQAADSKDNWESSVPGEGGTRHGRGLPPCRARRQAEVVRRGQTHSSQVTQGLANRVKVLGFIQGWGGCRGQSSTEDKSVEQEQRTRCDGARPSPLARVLVPPAGKLPREGRVRAAAERARVHRSQHPGSSIPAGRGAVHSWQGLSFPAPHHGQGTSVLILVGPWV